MYLVLGYGKCVLGLNKVKHLVSQQCQLLLANNVHHDHGDFGRLSLCELCETSDTCDVLHHSLHLRHPDYVLYGGQVYPDLNVMPSF